MKSFIRYPGGKSRELDIIKRYMPNGVKLGSYYEPFVGGGAVLADIANDKHFSESNYFINDKSRDLVYLYNAISSDVQPFYDALYHISDDWEKISEFVDVYRSELINVYRRSSPGDTYYTDFIDEGLGFIDKDYYTSVQSVMVKRFRKMWRIEHDKGVL